MEYPTDITDSDVHRIGQLLINAAATMQSLGHENLSGLLDYVVIDDLPDWHSRFVMDVVRCSRVLPGPDKQAAHERIGRFLWGSGWMARQADTVSLVQH